MLYKYKAVKRGTSHEANGEPCQDSLDVRVKENMLVAAVADGLGSEKHSDMASKKAASKAVEICASKIRGGQGDKDVLEIIRSSFQQAVYSIEDEAEKKDYPLDECNTTLSLAVFKDGQLYFGHAGDSGILALRSDGRCVKITKQQHDEEKRVFPLSYKTNWEFGKAEGLFAAVLLATDGLLETFFPAVLAKEPEPLYISHLMRFLDKDRLEIAKKGEEAVGKEAQTYIESIPPDVVDDDIALVVLINTAIAVKRQAAEYYKAPDFNALQKQREENKNKTIPESKGGSNLQGLQSKGSMSLRGLEGTVYTTDNAPFASGSEGSVYRISDNRNYAVKVYNASFATKERNEKLKLMMDNPPVDEALPSIAWPVDILTHNDLFAGFVMPALTAAKTLNDIYKETAAFDLSKRIAWGYNMCIAVKAVHETGCVIGDLDPSNIGVNTKTGQTVFFNADSFHVDNRGWRGKGKIYPALTCCPGYAAPEVLKTCRKSGKDTGNSKNLLRAELPPFTEQSDYFALAIHIFRLMFNDSPYSGVSKIGSGPPRTLASGDTAVENDQYCFKDGYEPASLLVPPLNSAPKDIGDLFRRAFIDGRDKPQKRPTPSEWAKALSRYEKALKKCDRNDSHYYYGNLPRCVWCEAEARHKENKPWPADWPNAAKASGKRFTSK